MSLLEKYLLLSLFVVFLFVFYRWLKRYLHRNEIQGLFPYVHPFGKATLHGHEVLKVELPQKCMLRVEILHADNSFIALAFEGELASGLHNIALDCSTLKPGSYQVKLVFPNQVTTRQIVVA